MGIDLQTLATSNLLTIALFLGGGAGFFLASFLKKSNAKQNASPLQEQQEFLTQTQTRANQMIDGSVNTSDHIIQTAKETNEHVSEDLDRILQAIAQKHIEILKQDSEKFRNTFETQLKTVNEQYGQSAQNLTQSAQNTINQNMQQFTQGILSKASQSEEIIDKKTQELLAQVELDVAEYKKMRMQKIDQKIEQLVEKTYQKVLRRSIPDTLHKELVLDSLEKAKMEGVLGL